MQGRVEPFPKYPLDVVAVADDGHFAAALADQMSLQIPLPSLPKGYACDVAVTSATWRGAGSVGLFVVPRVSSLADSSQVCLRDGARSSGRNLASIADGDPDRRSAFAPLPEVAL